CGSLCVRVPVRGGSMSDLANSPSLARMLGDLERRIRALEGAPQLQRASLTGGAITALNDLDQRVAEFGQLVGGGYGLAVNDSDNLQSLMIVSDDEGWLVPYQHHPVRDANDFVAVTSGSFVTVYRCYIPVPVAHVLLVN